MGKLTDVAIRAWIKAGERFEGRTDGDGLVLTWRPDRTAPHWRLRYRFAGKSRVMNLGSYTDLPLAAARQSAKELRAKTLDLVYRRRPRELHHSGNASGDYVGTVSVTAGSTAITGASTTFTSSMEGSIIRLSSGTTKPTDWSGSNPRKEERGQRARGDPRRLDGFPQSGPHGARVSGRRPRG